MEWVCVEPLRTRGTRRSHGPSTRSPQRPLSARSIGAIALDDDPHVRALDRDRRAPHARDAVHDGHFLGVRLVQLAQVAQDEPSAAIPSAGAASTCLGRSIPGEHERRGDPGSVNAEERRWAEAVAQEERMPRPELGDGLLEDLGTPGLPATVARCPIAVCTAETRFSCFSEPPPAATAESSRPVLVAIQGIPPSSSGTFSANAAPASWVQPTSGANPCTTAAGAVFGAAGHD